MSKKETMKKQFRLRAYGTISSWAITISWHVSTPGQLPCHVQVSAWSLSRIYVYFFSFLTLDDASAESVCNAQTHGYLYTWAKVLRWELSVNIHTRNEKRSRERGKNNVKKEQHQQQRRWKKNVKSTKPEPRTRCRREREEWNPRRGIITVDCKRPQGYPPNNIAGSLLRRLTHLLPH